MKKQIFIIFILITTLLAGCVSAPQEITEPSEIFTQPDIPTEPATEPPTEPETEPVATLPPVDLPDTDFVKVSDYIPDIVVDLRYATADNFTGQVIYDFSQPYLRYGTVKKLMQVQAQLEEAGYCLKIWDGFRPVSAQFRLWEICPDSTYVANPYYGFSAHSRGNTVDITIVHADGSEVEMPTGFDDFSTMADRNYNDCTPEAAKNANFLEEIMEECRFEGYYGEWWHYTDTDSYPVEKDFDPGAEKQ